MLRKRLGRCLGEQVGAGMIDITKQPKGLFPVELEIANQGDRVQAERGLIQPDKVHRMHVRAIVDSRVMRMVIPGSVAEQLRLEISGVTRAVYTDGSSAQRPMARNIHLRCGGREGVFTAVVEPGRESVLIGAIVLQDLDFLVDCANERLVPRDPKQIISEVE